MEVVDVRSYRWLGYGLIAMGAGLAANSLLGPLLADLIEYPLSETLLHQTTGLEAVSLVLVAPWAILAGVLALRGHRAAPILALGPATYVAYMLVQYIVGPEYLVYPGVLGLHMALFVVSGAVVLLAWSMADAETLPRCSARTDRRYAWVLFALGAFVASRYVPGLIEGAGGEPIPPDALEQPTMFWSIFWRTSPSYCRSRSRPASRCSGARAGRTKPCTRSSDGSRWFRRRSPRWRSSCW